MNAPDEPISVLPESATADSIANSITDVAMTPPTASLWRQFHATPWIDLLRGQLSCRLDVSALVAASELPSAAGQRILEIETGQCLTCRQPNAQAKVDCKSNCSRRLPECHSPSRASMASHYAADLAKNAHLGTQVFSDLSLLTAVANDLGFEQSFAEPLRRCAHKGDMLIAISSSGASPNILTAAETAKTMGLTVITLTAMDPKNPLRLMGALNFYVAASVYGLAETAHAAILHHWMDALEV